jgi:alpha-beta hydrolase superfamily lysophospholipase
MRALAGAAGLAAVLALQGCASPQLLETGSAVASARLTDDHYVARDGEQLTVSSWQAARPRAVFVAVHGFNEYAGVFRLPAPWFAERGISTYAYDQRGFGRTDTHKRGGWAGGDVMADDLKGFVGQVRARHPGLPVYVVGTSMGGAVVMKAAAGGGLEADGLILVAPAIWGWRSMNPILKTALWVTAHTVPDQTATGSQLKIWPSDNIDWLKQYSRDPQLIKQSRFDTLYGLVTLMDEAAAAAPQLGLPVLYLYGEKDEVVPAEPSHKVMAALSQPNRIEVYPQGYHMLLHDKQRETVYADIMEWIGEQPVAMPVGGTP